ncbi:MAG: trypsin-like peptidase domain-containing protein, partial [Pseudomonadota bacterium]
MTNSMPKALALGKGTDENTLLQPRIVSSDEEINVRVFDEVHEAVVNVVTTTLEINFWMELIPKSGQGSGFIIDREGYILTNNHVVENARQILVTLSGGQKTEAKLVGKDPSSDLAVIKIPKEYVTNVVKLGDSDKIKIGQKAIAIGNPFGLSQTLTTGIISALNREIKTQEGTSIENLMQTDAAINPGNSGGPLLNSNGEVIGINTAIFTLSGGSQGIGFAIPISHAKDIANQLITKGRVARPWFGITGIPITRELAEALGVPVSSGVMVVSSVPGGPAYKAGIHGGDRMMIMRNIRFPVGGDIIISLNKEPIS